MFMCLCFLLLIPNFIQTLHEENRVKLNVLKIIIKMIICTRNY